MAYLLAIIATPLAIAGIGLMVLFILGRFSQSVEDYEVVEFQEKKYLGRALPVIEHTNEDGETEKVNVTQIDQISYFLNPAIERQIIPVAGADGRNPSVFGYLKLVAGLLMLLPGFASIAISFEKAFLTGQVMYITLLVGMILGGWIALKLIQRS